MVSPNIDYTIYGVDFLYHDTEQFEKEYMEAATEYFFNRVASKYNKSTDEVKKAFRSMQIVIFQEGPIEEGVSESGARWAVIGRYYHNDHGKAWTLITKQPCISITAYYHELLHHISKKLLYPGDSDGDHSQEDMWDFSDEMNSNYFHAGDWMNCELDLSPTVKEKTGERIEYIQ
jgi:hypothetical protein